MPLSVRGVLSILATIVVVSAGGARGEQNVLDQFAPLADFESVEAFEAQLGDYEKECLDHSGGGAGAAACFHLYELWDRELNIQYKKLRGALDAAGKEKLTASQRDWITYRDSTIAFDSHLLDLEYTEPGTMWIGPRADKADKSMAAVVRSRALLLREWQKRLPH